MSVYAKSLEMYHKKQVGSGSIYNDTQYACDSLDIFSESLLNMTHFIVLIIVQNRLCILQHIVCVQ